MAEFKINESSRSLLLLPNLLAESNGESQLRVFSLPHPSNIESKQPIRLLVVNDATGKTSTGIYRIQHYKLQNKYLAESNKGSTDKAVREVIARTAFVTQSTTDTVATLKSEQEPPTQVIVYNDLPMEICLPYDIAFSLIGAIERGCTAESESEYTSCISAASNAGGKSAYDNDKQNEMNYLTLRDFRDMLIDSHHPNWRFIQESHIQRALENIADSVEEGGELYYRVSSAKVTEMLFKKVQRIVESFPRSLPVGPDLPENIKFFKKVIMSCNLLVSLVPKVVFQRLITDTVHIFEEHGVSINDCFRKWNEYRRETSAAAIEQKLLTQSAINIGVQQTRGKFGKTMNTKKILKKSVVAKPKVAVGKGAIDGFFSKKRVTNSETSK